MKQEACGLTGACAAGRREPETTFARSHFIKNRAAYPRAIARSRTTRGWAAHKLYKKIKQPEMTVLEAESLLLLCALI